MPCKALTALIILFLQCGVDPLVVDEIPDRLVSAHAIRDQEAGTDAHSEGSLYRPLATICEVREECRAGGKPGSIAGLIAVRVHQIGRFGEDVLGIGGEAAIAAHRGGHPGDELCSLGAHGVPPSEVSAMARL
jgi:hypothetical protein